MNGSWYILFGIVASLGAWCLCRLANQHAARKFLVPPTRGGNIVYLKEIPANLYQTLIVWFFALLSIALLITISPRFYDMPWPYGLCIAAWLFAWWSTARKQLNGVVAVLVDEGIWLYYLSTYGSAKRILFPVENFGTISFKPGTGMLPRNHGNCLYATIQLPHLSRWFMWVLPRYGLDYDMQQGLRRGELMLPDTASEHSGYRYDPPLSQANLVEYLAERYKLKNSTLHSPNQLNSFEVECLETLRQAQAEHALKS